MIETTKEQTKQAVNIVFRAMREMEKIFNTYGVNMATKIESANAIARLANSLDTRPHLIFGDINMMDDGGAEE